jgi:hypothetical protein
MWRVSSLRPLVLLQSPEAHGRLHCRRISCKYLAAGWKPDVIPPSIAVGYFFLLDEHAQQNRFGKSAHDISPKARAV